MRIKSFIYMFIIAFISMIPLSTVYAGEGMEGTLDFKKALELGIENSAELKLFDDKIEIAYRLYKKAQAEAEEATNKYWSSGEERIQFKKQELLYPQIKEYGIENLKNDKEEKIRNIKMDIKKLYFQILLKEKQVALQEQVVERIQAEYDVKKKEIELGKSTQQSLLPVEISVGEEMERLTVFLNEKDKLIMDMNIKLGLPIDQKLVLKDEELILEEFTVPDMSKLVNDSIESNMSIVKLKKDLELIKKEKNIVMSYKIGDTPPGMDVETFDENILINEKKIEDEKIAVEYKLRSEYNNLLNAKDEIEIKKFIYNKELEMYNVSALKCELGIISVMDNIKAQVSVDNALFNYNQAKLAYYIALNQYKVLIAS